MKKTLTMAAVAGVGIAGWMMYKKMNPNALADAKNLAREKAEKMLVKLEDMD